MDQEHDDMPLRRGRHKIRRKNKKLDRILNYLIALVSILIVISAFIIFYDADGQVNKKEQATNSQSEQQQSTAEDKQPNDEEEPTVDTSNAEQQEDASTNDTSTDVDEQQQSNETNKTKEENEAANTASSNEVTVSTSSDPLVEKVLVDATWQPTPTTQTGPHLSSYDEKSPDWQEKISTLLTTAGLTEEQAIVWSVKNNGGPQTAIGVISSKDKQQKYRIFIEWVDNKGWKPVKMEILKTLDGAY